MKPTCNVCNSSRLDLLLHLSQIPVHCNRFLTDRELALTVSRGDLHLAFCEDCGHVANVAFDEDLTKYDSAYDTALHFSMKFRVYAEALANNLIHRYQLHGKTALEIGCGDGYFLNLLCDSGMAQGMGFDPAMEVHSVTSADKATITSSASDEDWQIADLICCRHVLEHVPSPITFLENVREQIGLREHTILYFEVPNFLHTLRETSLWDLIYEHHSYFTPASLERAFIETGFNLLNLSEAYDGQFLSLEARPTEKHRDSAHAQLDEIRSMIDTFPDRVTSTIENWRATLTKLHQSGKRIATWGAGSKGVTFLNLVALPDCIECVVDRNPRKSGRFVAGSGHQILAPTDLARHQIDVILIMNPIYRDEILAQLTSLNLTPEVLCV